MQVCAKDLSKKFKEYEKLAEEQYKASCHDEQWYKLYEEKRKLIKDLSDCLDGKLVEYINTWNTSGMICW